MKTIGFFVNTIGAGGVSKSLQKIVNSIDKEKYKVHIIQLYENMTIEDFFEQSEKITFHTIAEKKILNLKFAFQNAFKEREFYNMICLLKIFFKRKNKIQYKKSFFNYLAQTLVIKIESLDIAIDYTGYGGVFTYIVAESIDSKNKITLVHTQFSEIKSEIAPLTSSYKKFDKIIAVSKSAKNDFIKLIPELKNKILHLEIPLLEKELILKSYEKDPIELDDNILEISLLLTVGRLEPEKNYILAIKTADKLKKENYKFKWFVIGEGSEGNQLNSLIKELGLENHVYLIGYKENPYPYFRQCDIYIQTSKYEGFGMAISEAKLFNRPIVTTNFEAAHEQLKNYKLGIITEHDTNELFKGIIKIIKNKENYSNNQSNQIKENQSKVQNFNEWLDLILDKLTD